MAFVVDPSSSSLQRRRQLLQPPPISLSTSRYFTTSKNRCIRPYSQSHRANSNNNDDNTLPEFDLPDEDSEKKDKDILEAQRLQQQAQQLRQQIRQMEEQLSKSQRPSTRIQQQEQQPLSSSSSSSTSTTSGGTILRDKRILVTGANGRLGSMVCRELLRKHPEIKEVVALVHVVGENSVTARGYGRLAYEVGAEDGIGTIGPAWDSENRTQRFVYNDAVMDGYNLQKIRIVECELLDPIQCATVVEGVDAVIWCATDFNGNTPRAISSLNVAFLFRAISNPTKGRVEVEGLENMLGALKNSKQDRKWKSTNSETKIQENSRDDPIDFVLVSVASDVFDNFETPFGEFNAMKREAEHKLNNYPSLSHTILQMGKYEDNFVEEGQPLIFENTLTSMETNEPQKRICINRRDAARAAVETLANKELDKKIVTVYTTKR